MTAPASNDHLYTRLAVAFARGHLSCAEVSDAEALELGRQADLRLHRFKRSHLPRVKRVLGILRGLAPVDLLDIGNATNLSRDIRARSVRLFAGYGARVRIVYACLSMRKSSGGVGPARLRMPELALLFRRVSSP